MISLIKKDFLLIKRYNIIMLLFTVVAPIIISQRTPAFQSNGFILYGLLVLMITFMNYHMIAMEEMKQKGMIYIQTTPISNKVIVLSKFIGVLISFCVVSGVYIILSKISLTKVGVIGLNEIIFILILIKIFYSIYIPLTFKLGYVKLQMVSAGIIFFSPFLTGLVSERLNNGIPIFRKLKNISNTMFLSLSLLIIVAMITISITSSSFILDKKEY